MHILGPDEIRAVLGVAGDFRGFVEVCVFAGLRLGEAAGLQLRDINFLVRSIRVERPRPRPRHARPGRIEPRGGRHPQDERGRRPGPAMLYPCPRRMISSPSSSMPTTNRAEPGEPARLHRGASGADLVALFLTRAPRRPRSLGSGCSRMPKSEMPFQCQT